jgi:hypothetical protein
MISKTCFNQTLKRRKVMKHILNKIIRNVKSVRGNSLAEFATTTALMATLAATAAPKLSEMSEGAKGEKSRNEIDKIIKQAGQFYQDTADLEGRGRFPNQVKFDHSIGGPAGDYINRKAGANNSMLSDSTNSALHLEKIVMDLALDTDDKEDGWDKFDEGHNNVWQSVFGLAVEGEEGFKSTYDSSTDSLGNVIAASGVQDAPEGDDNEWNSLFGDEVLESKFQDGHYVYTVIAGGGTGDNVYPPTIYVADVESAVDFNNVLMP